MYIVIKLKIRKELDAHQQLITIKLKGNLISKGYTEIIHILDHDDEFHINSFEVPYESKIQVQEYITEFINKENLTNAITIFK
jgi:hypothetical protein